MKASRVLPALCWFAVLAGMALLIWLGGPYLGIGSAQPLAAPAARSAAIALLLAAWAGWRLFRRLRARWDDGARAGDRADADERNERAAVCAAPRMDLPDVARIQRETRGGARRAGLPCYVVVGSPGSGKSTLLRDAGPCVPLPARLTKLAPRWMDGSRPGSWCFTGEAVLLDTDGHYWTQSCSDDAGTAARAAFLKLLHRQRRRLPVAGVILAVSTPELLGSDEQTRDEHARLIRGRLDELAQHLHAGLPVYLVFTKCDLIAGFAEYFHDLDAQQRGQVWGMSFPLRQTMDGSAAHAFAGEFKLLLERLGARLLGRLHAERDGPGRAAILAFPQQFAALGEIARPLVEGVFSGHAFGATLLFRGVYFTSSLQQGTPIDLVTSAVCQTFGLQASPVAGAIPARRRGFFAERLLRQVVFREAGIAGSHPVLKRRRLRRHTAFCAGLLVASALILFGLAGSHARNRGYLAQVQAAIADLPDRAALSAAKDRSAYLMLTLRRLEALSAAVDIAQQYRGHVPMPMRLGLYQGRTVGDALNDAYMRELNDLLLPMIAAQWRKRLVEHAGNPQALYYWLKAYLMLGEPGREHAAELARLARLEWQHLFSGERALHQALDRHFQVLIGQPGGLRTLPLDRALVGQARSTLRSADLATLIYGDLRLAMDGSAHVPLRLDKELGLLSHVFQRRSGTPLSQPLPAPYTQTAFVDAARQGIDQAVSRFAQDGWVLGAWPIDALERARLWQQVLGLYERDYMASWDALLDDLQLQPAADLAAASELVAKLAGPSSPLKLLLKLVRNNTQDLVRAPPATAPPTAQAGAAQAMIPRASPAMASAKTLEGKPIAAMDHAGQAIAEHFAVLNRLSEGAADAAPIDRTLAVFQQFGSSLLAPADAGDESDQTGPLLLARQQAAQLPAPVSNWMAALIDRSEALLADGAGAVLSEQFQRTVADDCEDFVRNRYPFSPDSPSDIPLQNFGEMFGYGGRFDLLYQQNLARRIDVSGKTWRWKRGPGAAAGPADMPARLQSADRIKQKYFRGGLLPQVDFTLLTPTLDPGVGRLVVDIDGQKYDYEPGGASGVAMKWPGPAPGRVSIAAYDTAGRLLGSQDYLGDWGFFRALQAAGLQRQSDLRFLARFDFAGAGIALPLRAGNLKHPFLDDEVVRFRCGGRSDAA